MEKAARTLGLRVAREGYCDRQYEDDGNLASRKLSGTVIKDPYVAAKQVVEMVVAAGTASAGTDTGPAGAAADSGAESTASSPSARIGSTRAASTCRRSP